MTKPGWFSGHAHGAGGSRKYKIWVPATLDGKKPVPLVMLLHGCALNAHSMAAISGMNAVADAHQFLVVYPEQRRLANLMKCWNWFDPRHQSRDAGEPSILASTIEQVCSVFNVDRGRIYVAGVSAGGAMAVIAGATYPDLFAAIAVFAGTEFKAATSMSGGLAVMKSGGPDPAQQGYAAFQAMQAGLARKPRRRMRVIVFHGSLDRRVNPVNTDQLIAQWSKTNACLAEASGSGGSPLTENISEGQAPNGYGYRKYVYSDEHGVLMEKWIVQGLGHAWSGSPQSHRYGNPKGPNASGEIWRFFNQAES